MGARQDVPWPGTVLQGGGVLKVQPQDRTGACQADVLARGKEGACEDEKQS